MQKRNENDKNTNFIMKNNKNVSKTYTKHNAAFFILKSPPLTRVTCFKLQRDAENIADPRLTVKHTLTLTL